MEILTVLYGKLLEISHFLNLPEIKAITAIFLAFLFNVYEHLD